MPFIQTWTANSPSSAQQIIHQQNTLEKGAWRASPFRCVLAASVTSPKEDGYNCCIACLGQKHLEAALANPSFCACCHISQPWVLICCIRMLREGCQTHPSSETSHSKSEGTLLHNFTRQPLTLPPDKTMGQRGMVTGQEFAALQDLVLALTEVVARMAQTQAATASPDPPLTSQFEESPLQTMEIISPSASEDFGNVGSGLEEDFPDQDLSALAGRAAEKLLLDWSPNSPLHSTLRQRPLPRFPEVAKEVHSTWPSPLSAPDPVQDFSSVMNVDGADKDGYLQFPPSLFQKAYLSAGEGCCALNTLGLLQAYQVALLDDLPANTSATIVMEIRQAADTALRLTRCVAQAMGRAMGACVVGHRHLWLAEAGVSEGDRMPLLDALYTPGKSFVVAEPNPTESLGSGCNGEDQFTQTTEMAPVKLQDCSQTLELIVKVKEEEQEGAFLNTEITCEVLKEEEDEEESEESVNQREEPSPASGDHEQHQEIQRDPGEGPYICSQFGKSFDRLASLTVHQRIPTGKKRYHCSQCGKSYSRSGNLKDHQMTHTGEKPYHCPQCEKSFPRLSHLKTHQGIHTGDNHYSHCGKNFPKSRQLKQHQRIHTGEKPYHCSQCGKRFSHRSTFNTHQQLHTGEKPYHCFQCGKSFTISGSLKAHERIHTGLKPYHCTRCEKCFSQLGALKTHQRIHTGEKPYHCSQCGKDFSEAAKLKRHQRIHTGEKPYHCSQCGNSYSQLGHLKTHQRIHTGLKPNQK